MKNMTNAPISKKDGVSPKGRMNATSPDGGTAPARKSKSGGSHPTGVTKGLIGPNKAAGGPRNF